MNSKRLTLIAAALFASVLLAGCEFSCSVGGSETVSAEELEKQVRLAFEDETGVLLKSIDCDEADADVGSEINCTAVNANDIELTIDGEVTEFDSDSERVRFDWEVVAAAAPGTAFETAAARSLRNQSGAVINDVTCPDTIELERGNEVTCTAVDVEGNERELVLTLTDAEGAFNVRLKPLDETARD